jgi:hypothetical protein
MAVWVVRGGHKRAEITWTSIDETLLQSRDLGGTWVDLAQWRPVGSHTIRDPFSDPRQTYEYRIWARKVTGAVAKGVPVTLVASQ